MKRVLPSEEVKRGEGFITKKIRRAVRRMTFCSRLVPPRESVTDTDSIGSGRKVAMVAVFYAAIGGCKRTYPLDM
jgi:hypothetical protein